MDVPYGLDDAKREEAIRHSLIEWYKSRAADKLAAGLERWWPKLGRGEKSRILIRDHRRQWGSCAADGTLRFNWRLVMTKPALIEYVVVHELAHLAHRNHSGLLESGVHYHAGCAPETEAAGRGGPTAPNFVRPILPSSPTSQKFRAQWLLNGRYTEYNLGPYRWSEMRKLVILLAIVALVSGLTAVLAGADRLHRLTSPLQRAHGDHTATPEARRHRIYSSSG